jgi:hypothetical protein
LKGLGFVQVSWLTFILITAPSHLVYGRTVACLRLSSRSQSRGGGRFPLPSLETKPTKNPQTDWLSLGISLFYPQTVLCPQPGTRGRDTLLSLWQVFWLPRPFSDLPIPIHWNSGIMGSPKNNFPFSHLSFRPPLADTNSQNPRNSLLFLWFCSFASTKSNPNLSANSANLFLGEP